MKTESAEASRVLTAELRKKVAENGIVVWLDSDRQYVDLVTRLRASPELFQAPIVSFAGSFLELMLALKDYGSETYPEKVLVHLPGINKETVRETPAYELYKAGTVFEKALATVVREAAVGFARPEAIETFLKSPELSLEAADQWLAAQSEGSADPVQLLLDALGTDAVVLGLMTRDVRLRPHLATSESDASPKIFPYLERTLGLSAAWRAFAIGDAPLTPDTVATLVASWLMAVEFVSDLKVPPTMSELLPLTKLGPFAKECRRLIGLFRQAHGDLYEGFANDLQDRFESERTSHHANELGSIDTFRFEEVTVRRGVLGALGAGSWGDAKALAEGRTVEHCFWIRRDPSLQRLWEVLHLAAQLGCEITQHDKGLERCTSLGEALMRYTEKLAVVDRVHRQFEQRAHAQIGPDLEDYDALLGVRNMARQAYRTWADALARQFHRLCLDHGPLPSAEHRQRTLYLDEVHPLVGPGTSVAYFMVDALRFEMAQGLAEELTREKYKVSLKARLAELPTNTNIGMNVLAPVEQNGRLHLVIKDGKVSGFSASESRVTDPPTRLRAISRRSLDAGRSAVDLRLEDFHSTSLMDLKKLVAGKPLLVVRSSDLDSAGESELHLSTFERTLTQLKSAISMLSQVGVQRFVVASDHGFLLQDPSVANVDFGASKRVPERRHALLSQPSGMADVLELPLSSLEMEADEPCYLVFRPDTALWKTKERVASFVHGGNSLQERVIPVLVVERQGARGRTITQYEVVARAEPAHLGRQRLRVSVRLQKRANASLPYGGTSKISLALRIPGDTQNIDITLLDAKPPASLKDGRLYVTPNAEEAMVEFELSGAVDDKVRVEIFHPEAIEEVTPKLVEGFFDVARVRRRRSPGDTGSVPPPSIRDGQADADVAPVDPLDAPPPPSEPALVNAANDDWSLGIEDEAMRKALMILAERRMINEEEVTAILGSPLATRRFSRTYAEWTRMLPFEIEIATVNGMKTWKRKD